MDDQLPFLDVQGVSVEQIWSIKPELKVEGETWNTVKIVAADGMGQVRVTPLSPYNDGPKKWVKIVDFQKRYNRESE